jgi:hypothetical protein
MRELGHTLQGPSLTTPASVHGQSQLHHSGGDSSGWGPDMCDDRDEGCDLGSIVRDASGYNGRDAGAFHKSLFGLNLKGQ